MARSFVCEDARGKLRLQPGFRENINQHVQTLHWVSSLLRVCNPPSSHDPLLTIRISGLAWHTDENALRQKFEEFGAVEEAVS